MNERIKEFAESSGLIKRNQQGKLSVWSCYDPDLEKFAELIEQECIDNFYKVWYEQGIDHAGIEWDKFMKRFLELSK